MMYAFASVWVCFPLCEQDLSLVLLAGMSWKSYDPNEWAESKVSLPVLLFCFQPPLGRQVPRELNGHGAPELVRPRL